MKRASYYVILTLIMVNTYLCHAQDNFDIEILGGPSLNYRGTRALFSNWGNGYIFGGGLVYRVSSSCDLALEASYQSYPYHGGNLEFANPGWSDYWISGKRSDILESSFVIRTPVRYWSNTIFSVRTGVLHVNEGVITIASTYSYTPGKIFYSKYRKSGTSDTKCFIGFGLSYNVQISSKLRILLEGRVYQTFDAEQTLFPIVVSLQYNLGKKSNPEAPEK